MKIPPASKFSNSKTAKPNHEVTEKGRDATAPGTLQQERPSTEITPEMIQVRAYQLYEQRIAEGKQLDDTSDWIEAERQLRSETVKKT